jgi:mobilome CxxCx(11)CxxC protein
MKDKRKFNKLRENCWNKALYSFATAWIFEKRASRLRWRLKLLTFLGIAVPLALGGTVASFGLDFKYLGFIVIVAGVLSITQLVGSLWTLVAKWQDEYAYSLESTVVNYGLSTNYKELGENPPQNEELKIKTNLLDIENRVIEESDYKHGISEKEKRMGHRAALRQFRRACVTCG